MTEPWPEYHDPFTETAENAKSLVVPVLDGHGMPLLPSLDRRTLLQTARSMDMTYETRRELMRRHSLDAIGPKSVLQAESQARKTLHVYICGKFTKIRDRIREERNELRCEVALQRELNRRLRIERDWLVARRDEIDVEVRELLELNQELRMEADAVENESERLKDELGNLEEKYVTTKAELGLVSQAHRYGGKAMGALKVARNTLCCRWERI